MLCGILYPSMQSAQLDHLISCVMTALGLLSTTIKSLDLQFAQTANIFLILKLKRIRFSNLNMRRKVMWLHAYSEMLTFFAFHIWQIFSKYTLHTLQCAVFRVEFWIWPCGHDMYLYPFWFGPNAPRHFLQTQRLLCLKEQLKILGVCTVRDAWFFDLCS